MVLINKGIVVAVLIAARYAIVGACVESTTRRLILIHRPLLTYALRSEARTMYVVSQAPRVWSSEGR